MGSKQFKLDKQDWIKLGKGAAIAAGGAVLAFAATWIGGLDVSTTTGALIAAVGSILINAGRKWIKDNT